MNYAEIKNQQPVMDKCFFAFNDKQFKEGKEKAGIAEGEKICSAGYGLYGTKAGIMAFLSFYDSIGEQIKTSCTPQQVYDYEYVNHECSYTGDDSEAMEIVSSYFTPEQCSTINRKNVRS